MARIRQLLLGLPFLAAAWLIPEVGSATSPDDYTACGRALEQLDAPGHEDTLMWVAALCHDAADDPGPAKSLREALLEQYPDSEHATDAQLELARLYEAIAEHEQAAAHHERFVAEHRDDPRAAASLEHAYLLRVGLGQTTEALADLDELERLAARTQADAAGVFMERRRTLTSRKAMRQHALTYLERYGRRGGLDRTIVAEATIGQLDWQRSCDEPLRLESCSRELRKHALICGLPAVETKAELEAKRAAQAADRAAGRDSGLPEFCPGDRTIGWVEVYHRSPKHRDAAQARFARILRLVADDAIEPPADPERARAFADAWAMSMFYRADVRYEALLVTEPPTNLELVVDDWRKDSRNREYERIHAEQAHARARSRATLDAFFAEQTRRVEALELEYVAVEAAGSPHWSIAAAARIADLSFYLAPQLQRAAVPDRILKREQVSVYCAEFDRRAEIIRERALPAYRACLERSLELGVSNEFSRWCEEQLERLAPLEYPRTHELFGTPTVTTSEVWHAPLVADPSLYVDG
jgi:hypothetical protein